MTKNGNLLADDISVASILNSVAVRFKFPRLNLQGKEGLMLEERLKWRSNKIKNDFASLVTDIMYYVQSDTAVERVKCLLKNSKFDKLSEAVQDTNEYSELFSRMSDYWSFFDYELLSMVSKLWLGTTTLQDKMKAYETKFKFYCESRVFEVFTEDLRDHLCLILDGKKPKNVNLKELEYNLSNLLDLPLTVGFM